MLLHVCVSRICCVWGSEPKGPPKGGLMGCKDPGPHRSRTLMSVRLLCDVADTGDTNLCCCNQGWSQMSEAAERGNTLWAQNFGLNQRFDNMRGLFCCSSKLQKIHTGSWVFFKKKFLHSSLITLSCWHSRSCTRFFSNLNLKTKQKRHFWEEAHWMCKG